MPHSRRALGLIALTALVGVIAWSWRPLPAVGAADPHFATNLPDRTRAIQAADSMFQLSGIAVDSLLFEDSRTLVVVVAPGALVTPVRMRDGVCHGGQSAWPATQRVARLFDELYGPQLGVESLEVRTQVQFATASGWGWRRACGSGGSRRIFSRRQLDSLQHAAG